MMIQNMSSAGLSMLYPITGILLLLYLLNLAMAIRQKNIRRVIQSVVLLVGTYMLNQMIHMMIQYKMRGMMTPGISILIRVPVIVYILGILVSMCCVLLMLHKSMVWNKMHISGHSVKESLDKLSSGLVFYDEEGMCVMVNEQMNQICRELTGQNISNGLELYDIVQKNHMMVECMGCKYLFHYRSLFFHDKLLYELRADDVTELVDKAEKLQQSNEQLAEMARRMKQLGELIDETVKEQEILQAKQNIHSTMNQLLLVTGNAAKQEITDAELQELLNNWKNNALMLCMQSDEKRESNIMQDVSTLARILGIQIVWSGDQNRREEVSIENQKILLRLLKEVLFNAAKHANATHLFVHLEMLKTSFVVTCTNDGQQPEKEIQEGGGLSGLRNMIELDGGQMRVVSQPQFELKVLLNL